ncbi:MAG: AAA family ATPase [Pirellulaceae bacterium]|nr:AAA family ATPase [Pirellulaceae bacterium]
MSEQISIDLTVQVEKISEQIVRAKPLGPWRIQVVDRSWREARASLLKKLEKATLRVLPARWFEGALPQTCERTVTKVSLPPSTRNPSWTEPIEVRLETFRWVLADNQCVVKIPAVGCTLFGKLTDLPTEVVEQHAKVALVRSSEKLSLWEVRQRFASRRFEYHNLSVPAFLGADPQPTDPTKLMRKRTATLRSVASDLSRAKLDPVYAMDQRVADLAEYFVGEAPQSVLLVGPAGVGKSSLVHRLVTLGQELGLSNRKIWSTSGARIVSGMSGMGMWQQRCHKLIREANQTQAILHLGSITELMEAGKIDGQPGVASMIRQSVARGKLQAIAECTPEQLAVVERDDPMLLRAFAKMEVTEAEPAKIVEILTQAAEERAARTTKQLQRTLGSTVTTSVRFTPQAIEELYRLHARYATYSALPSQPLRLMQTMLEKLDRPQEFEAQHVAEAFSAQTGLPEFLVNDAVPIDLEAIDQQLTSHVIGQAEPAELIVNLLATLKARMIRPGRPFASLLFIGPTGVGKTEMAKAIAKLLYSDTQRMIRIDMSEYASPWSAMKLIGRPGDGDGTLTSPIREQPFSVVLLDEFEKADPVVFDMLLQLLGEGRLTDSQGRLADFRNAVVIMTSNLGVESYKDSAFGFAELDVASWRAHFEREVQRFVRPELLGRIDRIVPFRPLPPEVVRQIAIRETELLKGRAGLKYSDATLEFTPAAIDLLSQVGYQPKYGARPLRRAIEQLVTIPLADKLCDASREYRWRYLVDALQGKIKIEAQQLARNTRELKDSQAAVINAWQQIGRMAVLVRSCAPLRDLENDIERQKRQNAVLAKKLKTAQGPSRIAILRNQLLTGQTEVERETQIRETLLQAANDIQREHLQLLLAWYTNQPIAWQKMASNHQRRLTALREATENALLGRATSNNLVTLMAVGKSPAHLEILWRAYRQLIIENDWGFGEYILRPHDPNKVAQSLDKPNAIDLPTLQLMTAEDAIEGGSVKMCDAYLYLDPDRFQQELSTSVGFAIEVGGEGAGNWLEDEYGIVHFVDPRISGAKRRSRVRVSIAFSRLASVSLPTTWLEPISSPARDPRRTFMMNSQTIQDPSHNILDEDFSWAHGKPSEALVRLIKFGHERSLWRAIGFEPIPPSAQINSSEATELAVPF